ncbi:MAG: hypothetical protein IID39_06885 [Planctomycetes bacterium]|nr:hypothetical protein [Planctomycetota bacterium]
MAYLTDKFELEFLVSLMAWRDEPAWHGVVVSAVPFALLMLWLAFIVWRRSGPAEPAPVVPGPSPPPPTPALGSPSQETVREIAVVPSPESTSGAGGSGGASGGSAVGEQGTDDSRA